MSSLLHQRLKASPRASTITRLVHLNSPSQWLEHICALQGAWHLVPVTSLKAWGSGKNNAMLVLPLSHGAAALLSSWLPLPPALPGLAGFRISHLRFSYLQAHLIPRATFHGQDMAVLWVQSQAKPISTEGPSLSGFAGHQGDPRRKTLNVPQQELKKSGEFQGRCLPDVYEEGDHHVDFSVNLCTSCHSEEEQEASILFATPHA